MKWKSLTFSVQHVERTSEESSRQCHGCEHVVQAHLTPVDVYFGHVTAQSTALIDDDTFFAPHPPTELDEA